MTLSERKMAFNLRWSRWMENSDRLQLKEFEVDFDFVRPRYEVANSSVLGSTLPITLLLLAS